MVAELRRAAQQNNYPRVVLVHQATPEEGDRFLEPRWPDVPAIADPEGRFYDGFGRTKARLRELVGPAPVFASFRAMARGHLPGRPIGDPTRRPGVFLVRGDRILGSHAFRHSGDHPDFATLPQGLGGERS